MNEILSEGLVMMCIGMGTVLLFLCTLIISMQIMSACVLKLNKWFPEAAPVTSGGGKKAISSNDEAIAVAIAAAISKG